MRLSTAASSGRLPVSLPRLFTGQSETPHFFPAFSLVAAPVRPALHIASSTMRASVMVAALCAHSMHPFYRRVAQVDMRARNAIMPLTVQHLQATQADLRELKHLQLLCDSYRSAQNRVFAAADPEDMPPVHLPLPCTTHVSSSLMHDATPPIERSSIHCRLLCNSGFT